MVRKKLVRQLFIFGFTVFLFSGCVPDSDKNDCIKNVYKMKDEINLRNSGIDPVEAGLFLCEIKRIVRENLKDQLAEIMYYPQSVFVDDKMVMIENKEEFFHHYDEIINAYIRDAVEKQTFSDLFSTSEGIMIGEYGAIWIIKNLDIGKMQIFKINNRQVN